VTRVVPIVFAYVPDPVGAGFVDSLARPGGNATGFTPFEYSIGGKWLELLKQIAPGVARAAVLRDPAISTGIGQFGAIQAAAPSAGLDVSPINMRESAEIERSFAAFAGAGKGGLIVTGSALAVAHRALIIKLAAQHKLPAVYFQRVFVSDGGLISYGPDLVDQFRRAAGYVDRVLKGEKPADLPVQGPTKYELVINLVWGDFCQGGASRILSIFLYLSFFVRPDKTRFFVPTHTSPCRRAQERSRLGSAPSCADPTGGLGLDGSEHGGTLGRSRDDEVEGSPRVVHEASCHILVFGGREAQTMMQ
jgi:ABC transporter substrate binding protein